MVKKEEHEESQRSVALAAKKAALTEKHGKTDRAGGSSLSTPSSWESFHQSDGVKLNLIAKDAEGKEIANIPFIKKQFSTGSYGWSLTDKIVLENGEGGSMSVSLNGNCES